MAGMFYSLQEAAEKLNKTEKQLKEIVKEGRLREFRDGPNLLFKVEEVEALMSELDIIEPEDLPEEEVPILEVAEPEIAAEEKPEAEEELPEDEALDLEVPSMEDLEAELLESEAEIPELEIPEEEIPDMEALEAEMLEPEAEVAEPEALEPEMPELEEAAEEPEALQPSESAADSDEILLAPETGAPLMSSDLTDADTALTGLGTSVLGETDQDYAITDDTMAETAIPTGAGGTTPEVPLEEIEGDVNLDTFGSGSGLLDLSLQADDTSLGGILDEIYTAEDEGKELGEAEGESAEVVAEAEQMISEDELVAPQAAVPEVAALAGPMLEMAPDAQSNTLGMLLFLPLAIVIYTTVVAVAGLKGIMPSILGSIQAFIWYIMGGAALVAGLVVVAAFMFTGERGTSAPKEKKVKVKKEKKPKEPKKPKEKKPKKEKKAKEAKKAKKGFLRLK